MEGKELQANPPFFHAFRHVGCFDILDFPTVPNEPTLMIVFDTTPSSSAP